MELFDVVQFFTDETYERVRTGVPVKEAVEAAHHYCTSVGAQMGMTSRVIITDQDDNTVFEWRYGQGVVFPTPEQRAAARGEVT